jgi:hypothetical protein
VEQAEQVEADLILLTVVMVEMVLLVVEVEVAAQVLLQASAA